MINHTGMRVKYVNKETWLPSKNIGHIDPIFHMHILGSDMNICAKYEVSMIEQMVWRTGQ